MEWRMGSPYEITRFPDWELRLGDYLESSEAKRFRYGTFDCCKFAAGAVIAMTGVDLMDGFQYDNARSAKVLMPKGLIPIFSQVMQKFGCAQVKPTFARRGDLIAGFVSYKPAIGIVGLDGRRAHFVLRKGLAGFPVSVCEMAWRVG